MRGPLKGFRLDLPGTAGCVYKSTSQPQDAALGSSRSGVAADAAVGYPQWDVDSLTAGHGRASRLPRRVAASDGRHFRNRLGRRWGLGPSRRANSRQLTHSCHWYSQSELLVIDSVIQNKTERCMPLWNRLQACLGSGWSVKIMSALFEYPRVIRLASARRLPCYASVCKAAKQLTCWLSWCHNA